MLDKIIDNGSGLYYTNTKVFTKTLHTEADIRIFGMVRESYLHPLFLSHRTHWYFGKRKPEEHFLWDI